MAVGVIVVSGPIVNGPAYCALPLRKKGHQLLDVAFLVMLPGALRGSRAAFGHSPCEATAIRTMMKGDHVYCASARLHALDMFCKLPFGRNACHSSIQRRREHSRHGTGSRQSPKPVTH